MGKKVHVFLFAAKHKNELHEWPLGGYNLVRLLKIYPTSFSAVHFYYYYFL
jgi:hypothetical protein